MNHPNSLRINGSDQAVADKPRLSGAHFSAVAPVLERVKFIFNESQATSSDKQTCEFSSTPRLSYNSPRLLDPASFARGKLSIVSNSASGQEHIRNDDRSVSDVHYNVSKYAAHVKSDYVTGKPLDGWLPAPSGLTRKRVTERVTGQNLPQALNEREDKSTSEDFSLKSSYQAGFDVKGRENRWDSRVQGYSATERQPWLPYSVNASLGRCSDDQRLAHKNAEGTSTSNEMRGLQVNRSSVIKPGLYSQVSEGEKTSISVGQQRVDVDRCALNNMSCTETPPMWKPAAAVYDVASRADASSADLSLLAGRLPFRIGNAPYGDSDIVVARRSFNDPKRIEFESCGQTLMVLKASSDDLGVPSYDSLRLKDSRRKEHIFDRRSMSHEKIALSNREDTRDEDRQFSRAVDSSENVHPVETRERSRVDFGQEMNQRAQSNQRNKEDREQSTSEGKSGLLVYKDYEPRSAKQEPLDSDRRLSLKLKEQNKASVEERSRKSEDRSSRSKESKAITDEFLRTKFLLEIGRRERELWHVANNSGCDGISTIGVRQPQTATGSSHSEDGRERRPMKAEPKESTHDSTHMPEPRAAVKRYDSERTTSHTTKPLSGSAVSSCMMQEHSSRRDEATADVRADRSRNRDEITSREIEDFKRPFPPAKTGYRITDASVGEKPHNSSSEYSADADREISDTQSRIRSTKESVTLSEYRSSNSATGDSSASDGNRTSASVRHKADPEREDRDGFLNEERVAFWENLKAQLEDQYLKRSPVKSQHRSSSKDKSESQSKDSCPVKEAGKTPKSKNSEVQGRLRVKEEPAPKKDSTEEQGRSRVRMEHTPNKEEQGKFRVKMESTSKTENKEEQGKFRVKMEQNVRPAEEWSSCQNKEAKKGIVKIQDRLPTKTKQTVRLRQVQSLNRSQKVSGQEKAERHTVRADQVDSLNRSQKLSAQEKRKGNVKSKLKMASLRPSPAVGKTYSEQGCKGVVPITAGEKQTTMKRKIVNKNVSKNSRQLVTETQKSTRNSNTNLFERTEIDDALLKLAHKSDDLRNLLNSRPRFTNWFQREIRHQKDERSVILKDDISSDEDELVIEVPGPRNRQEEDAMSVGSGSRRRLEIDNLDDRRMNACRMRGVDDEFVSDLPRKRFKFDENAPGRFARGQFSPRGRRAFEARYDDDTQDFKEHRSKDRRHSITKIHFQGEFQHRYSNAAELDDYHHRVDADVDDRHLEQFGNPDEAGYFDTDDRNRISNTRSRYQGKFRDLHLTEGNTRAQYLDEEPINQHKVDDTDQYPGDADERFLRNNRNEYYEDGTRKYRQGNYGDGHSETYAMKRISERDEERYPKRDSDRPSYDARYRDEDVQRHDTGGCDDDLSGDHAQKHIRQKSNTRYSNGGSEEHCLGIRGARYTNDDEKVQYLSHQFETDTKEHFHAEDYSRADVEEQGSHSGRHARFMRKQNRGRFERPNTHTITFVKLKGPKAFLKDLVEQNSVSDYAKVEHPCDIEVTVKGDFYEDGNTWDATVAGYQGEEAISDDDLEASDDQRYSREFDYGSRHNETAPLSSDELSHAGTRFGGPSRGSSFQTRLRGRFSNKSVRGFQPRLSYHGRLGFQTQRKKFLPTPRKFLRRIADPEFNLQSGDNISEASNSIQEAVKQVVSNIKEAEMADPEADAELFDTLSRGEKKQVIEIQQMTGIQCITAIVTALRTLWKFEPKVVRTLGNLEPEEIQQLGDDD